MVRQGSGDDPHTRVEALFDAAVDLPPAERAALLDSHCAERPTLRREVEVLLAYADMATDGAFAASTPQWSLRTAAVLTGTAPPFEPPEWMRPGTAIEQYELIRPLGSGGMSTVFLARDTQLARRVAIKFLHRPEDGFEGEARVTARCEHPHIVRIYAVGAFRGSPFIVLEHIAGEPLRGLIAASRIALAAGRSDGARAYHGLPVRQVAELMAPVARALEAAHGHGVVHCDLKPENIVVDRDGSPKVLDFGIARLIEGGLAPGALVGTPPYMSPEQLRGEPLDHRTDLWSAGVILFEMRTGTLPFEDLDAQISAAFGAPTPPAALAEAAPHLGPLHGLIEACLQPDPARRPATAAALADELETLLRGRTQPADEDHAFAGLAPFQATDAGSFFGRDREIEGIVGRLLREPRLLVIGPSGVGKSSLVRAGVGPTLAQEGWQVSTLRPGGEPLAALARALADVAPMSAPPTAATLRAEPGRLGSTLREAARRRGAPTLLVVDQFEELYTRGNDAETRAAFLASLRGAADDATAPVRVIATLRDDFLHRVLADERRYADVPDTIVSLGMPDRTCLQAALVGPVEAMGYRFEDPALVDELLDGLEACAVPLPILQFTAQRLWSARDRRRRLVTRAGYSAAGGVDGALAEHADDVFAGLPRARQALARRLLERLVTPERTRSRVESSALSALDADPTQVRSVVSMLVDARLLAVEVDADGVEWVELAHEALIARWPRLQTWLSEVDRDTAFEARVRAAAVQWDRAGRSLGLLWRDRDAREAIRWSQRHPDEGDRARLGADGGAFITAVVRAARRRRVRRQAIAVGAVLVLLAATIVFAHLRRQAADEARRAADWARISVARNLEHDPTTMLAVLREVEGERPPSWSRLVRWALERNPARAVLEHPGLVSSAVWSPDGSIVTACGDETIRIWRPDGLAPERTWPAHYITRLRFDAAGRRLASAGKDGTVRIWSLDGDAPPEIRPHPAQVYQAVFDADGRRLATAGFDGKARLWNANGVESFALDHGVMPDGSPTRVYGVAFAAGGRELATVAFDGRLRRWSARSGELLSTVDAHSGQPAVTVDAAPDGRIATGGLDDHLRVWTPHGQPVLEVGLSAAANALRLDVARGRVVAGCADGGVWSVDLETGAQTRIGHHVEQVHGVDVSSTGDIVSASLDGTARVWSMAEAPPRRLMPRHTDAVVDLVVTADGQRLITAGVDGRVIVGPLDGSSPGRTLYAGEGRLSALSFDRNGQQIAVADPPRGIVRLHLDGADSPAVTPLPETWLTGLAFTPEGRLAATDIAGRVRIWPAHGRAPSAIGRHPDRALAIAIDSQGRFAATSGADLSVRLWALEPGIEPLLLGGHPSVVRAVAIDPDGTRVAAGTLRGTWLWSIDTRPPTRRALNHDTEINAIVFAPDGQSVATAATDRTLRIWPVSGGAPVVIHDDSPLHALAFTPDGQALVGGAADGTVRVYRGLRPIDPADLWTMSYCLSAARRRELLGISASEADEGRRRCEDRVRAARDVDPPSQ